MLRECCVLVSGGLDSYVAYFEAVRRFGADEVEGLFIDYGQPYLKRERSAINALFSPWNVRKISVPLVELQRRPTPEDPEIYGRNLLLAFYGSLLAKRVWLSSLESEVQVRPGTWDHGPIFSHAASSLFSLIFQSVRPETIVESPWADKTKSQVLSYALNDLNLHENGLNLTVSCYAGSALPCGECKACFKRWVAFANNGLEEKFMSHPAYSAYAAGVVCAMREVVQSKKYDARFTKARCVETHNAYMKSKIYSGKIYGDLDGIGTDVHSGTGSLAG